MTHRFRITNTIPRFRARIFILSTTSTFIACYRTRCMNDNLQDSKASLPTYKTIVAQKELKSGSLVVVDTLYKYCRRILIKYYNILSDLLRISIRAGSLFLLFSPSLVTWPIIHIIGNDYLYKKWWDLLRISIRLAGPCLSKFAQWISTRPDLFPDGACKELEVLQSNGIQHGSIHSTSLIKEIFGVKEKDLIIRELKGSGCVAQVYRGNYKDNDLAIKVIHPHARASIEWDLKILQSAGRLLSSISTLSFLCISESIEEFSKLMMGQLNMQIEANSLKKFRENFSNSEWTEYVIFPKPSEEFSFSKDVLVESYEDGLPMSAYLESSVDSSIKKELAKLGLEMFMKMVFEDNFMHSDLHPGNMLVRKSKSKDGHYQIVVLDAGLVTSLSFIDRRNFIDLFHAIVDNNGLKAAKLMVERSKTPQNVINQKEFETEVDKLIKEVHQHGLNLGRIDLNMILKTLLISCYKHNVRLDPNFTSVLLSIGILEGLGKRLDPDLNVLFHAAPFILHSVYSR